MNITKTPNSLSMGESPLLKGRPNPKTQITNLVALAILSGAVAFYAANFLVALPLTVITLTVCGGSISLVSSIAAASLKLCNEEIKILQSPKYKDAPLSKFPKFPKNSTGSNLTPENVEIHKIQILEAVSAKAMTDIEEPDIDTFIADPFNSLRSGMWLLEGESQIISALERLRLGVGQEQQPLVKVFGLESLSQEFREIFSHYKKCYTKITETIEEIQAQKSKTTEGLKKETETQKKEYESQLQRQIEAAYAFYTKPRQIPGFRRENTLKPVEDLLKLDLEILSIERKMATLQHEEPEATQALKELHLLKEKALEIKINMPPVAAKLYESAQSNLTKEIERYIKTCTDKMDKYQKLLESALFACEQETESLIYSAKQEGKADLVRLFEKLNTDFIPQYNALFSS